MTTVEDAGHRGFAGAGRRDNERLFRRARRHSRHVRVLRIAIPIVLVLVLGAVTAMTWLDPMRLLARLPASANGMVISGTKITMAQPKISGYTRDQRWYELTAHSAAQDITKPDLVELEGIHAKLEAGDKSTMLMMAEHGQFDRKAGVLRLERNIVLTSSSGYEVRLAEAVVDTGSGDVVSNKPVSVRMQQGTLDAARLELIKAGEIVRFDGGVTMNLTPAATSPDDQAAAPQQ